LQYGPDGTPKLVNNYQPPAPASPNPYPSTPDAQAISENAFGAKVYGDSLGQQAGEENRAAGDYGFDLQRGANVTGPDGRVTPGQVTGFSAQDPATNPFSRAAQLQRSYQDSQRRTNTGFAARGHLYSGGRNAAQTQNTLGFEQGKDTLNKAFANLVAGWGSSRTGAANQLQGQQISTSGGVRDRLAANPVTGAPKNPAPTGDYRVTPGKSKSGVNGEWHTYPNGRRVFVAR